MDHFSPEDVGLLGPASRIIVEGFGQAASSGGDRSHRFPESPAFSHQRDSLPRHTDPHRVFRCHMTPLFGTIGTADPALPTHCPRPAGSIACSVNSRIYPPCRTMLRHHREVVRHLGPHRSSFRPIHRLQATQGDPISCAVHLSRHACRSDAVDPASRPGVRPLKISIESPEHDHSCPTSARARG